MAYKQDNRKQGVLFPESISDYISPEDPVRVYDEFVELLDLQGLGIILDPNKKGTSSYNPKMLLKVLVYSCLLYTSPSPRDRQKSRMPSSA